MQTHTKNPNLHASNGHHLGDALQPILNGKVQNEQDGGHSRKIAPPGTFDKTPFNQLIRQYDLKHDLPPTLEITQAFLMTQNMKETAARVSGLTAGGSSYYLKNDYVGDCSKLVEAMHSVNRLLGNLGTSDKASNFLLEQRNLLRAQSRENKEIRDLIDQRVVDGLEYIRMKEQIAETKSRVKDLLDEKFSSEEDEVILKEEQKKSSQNGAETQEDSEEAQKSKEEVAKRIQALIKQLRKDGKTYLNFRNGGINQSKQIPLSKVWKRLRANEKYMKKRDSKALHKDLRGTIQKVQEQLNFELKEIKQKTVNIDKSKKDLNREVLLFEQVHGLEKRLKTDTINKSVSELDQVQMTSKSYELQNILFNYCGVNLKGGDRSFLTKKGKDLFGRIKKLPQKSTLLQCYQDQGENKGSFTQNENSLTNQARKKNIELVKVIGIEPEKFFQNVDKYRICIDKMPKFSNVFERAEPLLPGLGMTVAGSLMANNANGQMNFARVDGRNVISLQFNPYELEDPQKKKIYDQAVKELVEQREKIKSISKQAKEKQEQSNIKRAWLNIVKKDIPKAYRGYQKYKADLDNNTKKYSQQCLKEVRKVALKTQRLQKDTVNRAKKLTKEMMNFWKKRDKELADLKRRKEKFEKEIKRKQEEEKEALLQKKRLEYLMQQSEIYAHFMASKLGLLDEQQKQKQQDMMEEKEERISRVDVDTHGAKKVIAGMINENQSRIQAFDKNTQSHQSKRIDTKFSSEVKEEDLQMDKFDNPGESQSKVIEAPKCFKGNLKDYQMKGLRWLDNLYEQGINGILADEMGLGKTIQAIALLAHLAENKGDWGPFLIIVPVTTLHNWQNELAKFCPMLKVLPYFGNPEERKKFGRFLDPKNLSNPQSSINVLLTSYNLIVNNQKDQAKLLRVNWRYMILDEAQAIKNNLSRRWKVLLQFNARNRLLLTGTPIQNTMAELWALLHFIMPKLFDSHEQFQEWFSKDIEASQGNQGDINKHQLKRLHLVLKPFMLRRLKKDVEQEIGPKTEFDKYCEMTHRQRVLYQRIKNKISTKDLFQLVDSKAKMENLMNLVMQFRKVCNHPELFERRVGRIPFSFRSLQQGMSVNPNHSSQPEIRVSMSNPITYEIPKLVYDECFLVSENMTQLFTKFRKGEDVAFSEIGLENHMRFFNIFNSVNLNEEMFKNSSFNKGGFGILRLLQKSNKWSINDLSYLFVADPLIKQVALMHYYSLKQQRKISLNIHNSTKQLMEICYNSSGSSQFDLLAVDFVKRDPCQLLYRRNNVINNENQLSILPPLITDDLNDFTRFSITLKNDLDIYVNNTVAETLQLTCRSSSFNNFVSSITNNWMRKKILLGQDFVPKRQILQGKNSRDRTAFLTEDSGTSWKTGPPKGYPLFDKGIIGDLIHEKGACLMELPNYSRLVSDCAKMQFLDKLLATLNKEKHRCLIFCQMTRMLDILEDFLSWRKYTYFRMDGSTSIPDRRYMVEEYQKNKDIFAFLLSTRAGGLGVNLTGADTVIFYDNDWNPTMDAQATDRAHRIGQTKAVSVYRIITKGTVEEKIVKRAKQKQNVQSTVYGGNALKADVFRPKDVVEMLLDEQEQNELRERSAKFLKTKRIKKKYQSSSNPAGDSHQANTEDALQEEDEDGIQINTSSNQDKATSNNVFQSPLKVSQDKQDKVKKQEVKKAEKKIVEKTAAPVAKQNIFSTVRSSDSSVPPQKSAGPFSVFTVSRGETAASKGQEQLFSTSKNKLEEDQEMEEEYQEESEEEDEEELKKINKLFGKPNHQDDSDDDEDSNEDGVEFDFDQDETNVKPKKGVSKKKEELPEEDDEMVDEY